MNESFTKTNGKVSEAKLLILKQTYSQIIHQCYGMCHSINSSWLLIRVLCFLFDIVGIKYRMLLNIDASRNGVFSNVITD
jgi:hypothetical protein